MAATEDMKLSDSDTLSLRLNAAVPLFDSLVVSLALAVSVW